MTDVGTFIVVAIAGMWAIDYFYAPEMLSPDTLPEAVGKCDRQGGAPAQRFDLYPAMVRCVPTNGAARTWPF